MKILVISEAYPSKNRPYSGLFVQKLIQELDRRGHEILVVCPRGPNSNWGLKGERDGAIKVEFPVIPSFFRHVNRKTLFDIEFEISCKICLRSIRKHNFQPDVVYAHFAFGSGVIASRISKRVGAKFALALGESSLETILDADDLKSRAVKSTIQEANAVACVSQHLKNLALNVAPQSSISYIPNGVDLTTFFRKDAETCRNFFGVPGKGTIFGFVGTLSERKGYSVLKTLSEKLGSKFQLMLATGSKNPDLPALHCGFVENRQLSTFLSACDYFIFPTTAEGMSNALLEAMACGLVVITSDTAFNREFLNESNSILLDFNDIDRCTSVIASVIKTPEKYRHLATKASQDIKAFSLDRRADRIDAMLRKME